MKCNNCGGEIPEGSFVCPSCGVLVGPNVNTGNADVQNPVTQAPEVQAVQNPGVQAPGAQAAQKPGGQTPGAQAEYTQDPGAQAPGAQAAYTQNPGAQAPGAQAAYTQNPGAQAPGAQAAYTQNPGAQIPGAQNFGGPQGQAPINSPKPKIFFYKGGQFGERVKKDRTILCSVIAASALLFFCILPAWVSMVLVSCGLFGDGVGGFGKFVGFLLFITAAALLFSYLVIFNVIGGVNLKKFTDLPYSEWYGPAGALLFFIMFSLDGRVRTVVGSPLGHYGFSWWMSLFAIGALFVRPVMFKVNGKEFY
ncbi:hypothetical protein [Eubacterium sp.]|uniref:hypothetical protein n=1 Tax=Eubacterium sp. TaxID=142586 RepID=UPI00258559D3|nr:hypothetical protein [Eubacterium sp.]MCR5368944.1 TFIIB-type zinc ribbon-containing protein [Eubacterium sp.]